MTFNENASVGGNTARRRGGGIALAGGGITGIGAIAVLLLGLFTGGDFSSLLGPLAGAGGGGQESEVANCETGADANASDDCRLAAASLNLDQYWAKNIEGYRQPQLIIVDQSTSSACGTASNADRPVLLPARRDGVRRSDVLRDPPRAVRCDSRTARPALRARARVRPPRAEHRRHHGGLSRQRHGARQQRRAHRASGRLPRRRVGRRRGGAGRRERRAVPAALRPRRRSATR